MIKGLFFAFSMLFFGGCAVPIEPAPDCDQLGDLSMFDAKTLSAAMPYAKEIRECLQRAAFKRDGRVLAKPELGGAINLIVPAALQTDLRSMPPAATGSVTFTPIFEARADNQASPEMLTL